MNDKQIDSMYEAKLERDEETIQDEDEKYDAKKIDDAFPPVQPEIHEEPKRPPIVLQHVTLTYADGRTGSFTGKAIMTMAEHSAANLRLVDVQVSQPQVVAVAPETPGPEDTTGKKPEQMIASIEQVKEAIDAGLSDPVVMGAIEELGKK